MLEAIEDGGANFPHASAAEIFYTSVTDLDTPTAIDALRALTEAIATDRTLRKTLKSEMIRVAYGGKSTLLTGEWEGVLKASDHLLKTQARRYAGEYTRE